MAKNRKPIKPIYPYDPLAGDIASPSHTDTNTPPSKLFSVAALLAMITTIATIVLLVIMVFHVSDLMTARSNRQILADATEVFGYYVDDDVRTTSVFDAGMREINPNFVCWITINGTKVDYPVVRAADNIRYLDTSFFGERNAFGTLFMDYRNVGAYVPHIIIYGHNTADGSKFGTLRYFLDYDFMEAHPTITLRVNDRIFEYQIFAARLTDVNDPAYFLDFATAGSFHSFLERINAPLNAVQILTLSTCVSRGDDDERLIVQGALLLE